MNCVFRCDQCGHEEWRAEEQEPWLCAVCGYMRWSVVADGGPEAPQDMVSFAVDSNNPEDDEDL